MIISMVNLNNMDNIHFLNITNFIIKFPLKSILDPLYSVLWYRGAKGKKNISELL